MSYRERRVVSLKELQVNGEIMEERVTVITEIRKKDCKCNGDPYSNGCIHCTEVIEPFICPKCHSYYCKCVKLLSFFP